MPQDNAEEPRLLQGLRHPRAHPRRTDADLAFKIGRAYAAFLQPRRVAVGHDIRLSSPEIAGGAVSTG